MRSSELYKKQEEKDQKEQREKNWFKNITDRLNRFAKLSRLSNQSRRSYSRPYPSLSVLPTVGPSLIHLKPGEDVQSPEYTHESIYSGEKQNDTTN